MSEFHLVLASRSPRRRELLTLLGLPFEVTAADVVETPRAGETPARLVTRLSRAKANRARQSNQRNRLVIGCDTIVALDGDILGKPSHVAEAQEMLYRLRGRFHAVYSSIAIVDSLGRQKTELAKTRLLMRTYNQAEVEAYASSGDPLDKAGAYAIQHEGFHPVEQLVGCYAGVMGLPLCHLAHGLREWGVEPAVDLPTACHAYTGHRCAIYQGILAP
jgi:septum formation protein